MATDNNRGSAQQQDKQGQRGTAGSSGTNNQKGSGQGQVKDPQNDGRLKENR